MKQLILSAAIAIAATAPAAQAETAQLELGDFATTTKLMDGSAQERGIPFNYIYKYSGGQILYPYELIKDIADKNGEITGITFRYLDNGMNYSDLQGSSTIWAMPTDMASLPVGSNGKSVWVDYDNTVSATVSIDFTQEYYYENDFEVTYNFSTPVKLAPGQGLLITGAAEVSPASDNSTDFDFYAFRGGNDKYTAFYGSDTKTFADDYAAKTPNSWNSAWLPVAKIEYTWVDKLPQAEAPVFSPASGTALGPDDKVTITAAEGATILYTLEKGATPDLTYEAPLSLDKATTVTAIATMTGHEASDPGVASYTLKVTPDPAFAIPGGTLLGANEKVVINAAEGASVLYTLDPDAEPDIEYPADGITLTADATVKAVAVAPGSYKSDPVKASYTVSELNATLVGDYYAAPEAGNMFIGTNWYNAPVIPTYANSASQMLYLPSELDSFTDKTRIRTVKFRFFNETCFVTYTSKIKLFIEAIDATAFQYDTLNSKYSWFESDLSEPLVATDIEIDFLECYFDTSEITLDLPDGGFEMPLGKSLLITVVNESPEPLSNSEYPQFFKYNTPGVRRTATFASDYTTFTSALATNPYVVAGDGYYSQMTDGNQPCVKLYTDDLGTQGISAPGVARPDSEAVEYYNLQGIRVHGDLAPGVYITRRGTATGKILVK